MKKKILLVLAGLGTLFGAYLVINQDQRDAGLFAIELALLICFAFLLLNTIYDLYVGFQEIKENEEAAKRLVEARRAKLENSRLVPPMAKPYTRKSFVAVEPNIIYAAGVAGVADPSKRVKYSNLAPIVAQEDNLIENVFLAELILEAIDSKYSHTPMEDTSITGQGGNFSGAGASGDWEAPSVSTDTFSSSDFGSCDVSSSLGD
jgi:hypothetical protein